MAHEELDAGGADPGDPSDGGSEDGDSEGWPRRWWGWMVEEEGYQRRVAILLAVVAVLGAWIAVLATNAGTNESRDAREATRLAAQSQTLGIIERAAVNADVQAASEVRTLPFRRVFASPEGPLDEDQLDEATETILADVIGDERSLFDLRTEANRSKLTQATTVETRVTWNARASQYETVVTVLGVALFLIGFTLVVSSRVRPPIAVPGFVLVVFVIGWAVHIYNKPIPDTPDEAIAATALGQALMDDGRVMEAIDSYTQAIEADDDYEVPWRGRGLAHFALANPDILRTGAITSSDPVASDAAVADITRAIELGGDDDPAALFLGGIVTFADGRYDLSAELLQRAVELNPLTPDVQLTRSAVEAARGDETAALDWRERAVDLLAPTDPTDRTRGLASGYYTLLQQVAAAHPGQSGIAEDLLDQTIAGETALFAGRDLTFDAPDAGELVLDDVRYADGELNFSMSVTGVADQAIVTVVGYERPAEGAAWVQPTELFYVGPPPLGRPNTIPAPRACSPLAHRFDLYVEGVRVDHAEAEGGDASC